MLLEKKLFLAPISANPQSILDLGTGTGAYRVDEKFARPDRLI
jgi:methylase of polypeptide subunit release factors